MANLAPSQIAQLAANAGFTGAGLSTITAISLAESGGNPGAINYNDPGGSYGLTQINAAAHGSSFAQAALDPQTALNEAFAVSGGGTNFSPWSTYNSGAYLDYMQQAQSDTNLTNNYSYFGVQQPPTQSDYPFTPQEVSDYGSFGLSPVNDPFTPQQGSNYGSFGLAPVAPLDTGTASSGAAGGSGLFSGLTSFIGAAGPGVALAVVAVLMLIVAIWPSQSIHLSVAEA